MFLLGVALVLFSFMLAIVVLGGWIVNFIDSPSFLFIVVPLVGVLTATRGFKLFYVGLKAAVFHKSTISEKSRRQAISLFRLLSKTVWMSAAIATLICLINILMSLDFSDAGGVAVLGGSIAASLTSLIYGFLLIMAVFEPVVYILKKRYNATKNSSVHLFCNIIK